MGLGLGLGLGLGSASRLGQEGRAHVGQTTAAQQELAHLHEI